VFVAPADGATVNQAQIVVSGMAAPGSIVTRDIPLSFDDHTTADSAGNWSFNVQLNPGMNVLVFRIADDRSTEKSLTIYYVPA
jgi:hypothetical protein